MPLLKIFPRRLDFDCDYDLDRFAQAITQDWVEVSQEDLNLLNVYSYHLDILIVVKPEGSPTEHVQTLINAAKSYEESARQESAQRQARADRARKKREAKSADEEKSLLKQLIEKYGLPE